MLRIVPPSTPREFRNAIYAGEVMRLPATVTTKGLVAHLRHLLAQAFGPSLERLHERYSFAAMAGKLADLRQALVSDPKYLQDIAAIAGVAGNPSEMAFD